MLKAKKEIQKVKELPTAMADVFSCEFCEFFQKAFSLEQLQVTASVTSTLLE